MGIAPLPSATLERTAAGAGVNGVGMVNDMPKCKKKKALHRERLSKLTLT